MYENMFIKHLGKFRTHWLRPYEITYITEGGVTQLKMLKGEWKEGMVNQSQLKLYFENQMPHSSK
jgi:hypothetical protein